ncbi:valacyclovir hydrolase [Anoplophora glabripennis]|uniref:Valacyclovir hydrolase n=1 Tax=Anoplophora glabripennis TaxID=217634 RepID=V5I9D2_ANOGL|nr:valacyclovir hydrolase [Anoplophora glabripennis]
MMVLPIRAINLRLYNRYFPIKNFIRNISREKEQKIDVDGQTINYIKVGNGEKKILCFPGAMGTIWTDFKPQIEELDREKFTIVVWEPPGYGRSRPPNRNFNLDVYKNDAEVAFKFMKKLDINKFSLLGWSDGAKSSLILSSKYPEHVEKLVVWGATSYVLPEEVRYYEEIRDINNWSERMKEPLIKLYTERGLQDMSNGWCDTLKNIQINGGDICKNDLQNIKCPTFILHGDKDPMLAAGHPEYLMSRISNAKLHRFPEGKHNIHLKYAREFNKMVTDFLLN